MTAARTFLTTRKKKKSRDEATNIAVKRLEKAKKKICLGKVELFPCKRQQIPLFFPQEREKSRNTKSTSKIVNLNHRHRHMKSTSFPSPIAK
jgi:hypothetical protein